MNQRPIDSRDARAEVWPKAVVFDFDGLLMDTESSSLKSWEHEWRQWGLELDASTFFVNHGGDITEDRYAQLAAAVGERFDQGLSHRRRVDFRNETAPVARPGRWATGVDWTSSPPRAESSGSVFITQGVADRPSGADERP